MNRQSRTGFDIEQLRLDVASCKRLLRITTHAQLEAFKDGFLLANLRYVFQHGSVIEVYPDEARGLLYAVIPENALPLHIVIEDTFIAGIVVTAYVPDKRKWSNDQRRRATGRLYRGDTYEMHNLF